MIDLHLRRLLPFVAAAALAAGVLPVALAHAEEAPMPGGVVWIKSNPVTSLNQAAVTVNVSNTGGPASVRVHVCDGHGGCLDERQLSLDNNSDIDLLFDVTPLADGTILATAAFSNGVNGALVGDSAPKVTKGSAPSAPRNVQATPLENGHVIVSWDAPDDAGSSPIVRYHVGYNNAEHESSYTVGPSLRSVEFVDVPRGAYRALVIADNDELMDDGLSPVGETRFATDGPPPAPEVSSSPTASPTTVPVAPCTIPRLYFSGERTVVNGTRSQFVIHGSPSQLVELRGYSRPSKTEVLIHRPHALGSSSSATPGQLAGSVLPPTNSRLFAVGVRDNGDGTFTECARSDGYVINVRLRLGITVRHVSGAHKLDISGPVSPAAQNEGRLVSLYSQRDGQSAVRLADARVHAGVYRFTRSFATTTSLRLFVRSEGNYVNAAGQSAKVRTSTY